MQIRNKQKQNFKIIIAGEIKFLEANRSQKTSTDEYDNQVLENFVAIYFSDVASSKRMFLQLSQKQSLIAALIL